MPWRGCSVMEGVSNPQLRIAVGPVLELSFNAMSGQAKKLMAELPYFWSTFVVDDVPGQFQRFLHRGKAPAISAQTTGYYAHGYSYAFERLIMIALDLGPEADYLRMPTFFLARHSAELHLKKVIKEYSAANGEDYSAAGEHSLLTLWNQAIVQIQLCGWPVEDQWTQLCARLVKHLHDFDNNGQRFRYPDDNAGKPFEYTRIELQELGKAHANITTWCEAATDMLKEEHPFSV